MILIVSLSSRGFVSFRYFFINGNAIEHDVGLLGSKWCESKWRFVWLTQLYFHLTHTDLHVRKYETGVRRKGWRHRRRLLEWKMAREWSFNFICFKYAQLFAGGNGDTADDDRIQKWVSRKSLLHTNVHRDCHIIPRWDPPPHTLLHLVSASRDWKVLQQNKCDTDLNRKEIQVKFLSEAQCLF